MRIRSTRLLLAGALALASSLWAQKPKSPKEVEAINAISAAKTPDDQIKAIENVLTKFADTEFKRCCCKWHLQIETQKGDFAQTMFYGQRLLEADPKNAIALVTLAGETARQLASSISTRKKSSPRPTSGPRTASRRLKSCPRCGPTSPMSNGKARARMFKRKATKRWGCPRHCVRSMTNPSRTTNRLSRWPLPRTLAPTSAWDKLISNAGKLDEANDAFDKAMNCSQRAAPNEDHRAEQERKSPNSGRRARSRPRPLNRRPSLLSKSPRTVWYCYAWARGALRSEFSGHHFNNPGLLERAL